MRHTLTLISSPRKQDTLSIMARMSFGRTKASFVVWLVWNCAIAVSSYPSSNSLASFVAENGRENNGTIAVHIASPYGDEETYLVLRSLRGFDTENAQATVFDRSGDIETFAYYSKGRAILRRRNTNTAEISEWFCLGSEDIPPLYEIGSAILQESVISPSVEGPPDCHGRRQQFLFAGIPYVFCSEGSSASNGPIIIGQHLRLSFIDTSEVPTGVLAVPPESLLSTCPKQTKDPVWVAENTLEKSREVLTWPWPLRSTQSNSTGTHNCIFVHGLGEIQASPSSAPSFEKYWNQLHGEDKPSYCKTTAFLHLNTVDYAWFDPQLQQQLCSLMKPDSQGRLVNSVVFTHSMGNLIFAGALANDVCSLAKSSAWYTIEAPFLGSKGADMVAKACTFLPKALEKVPRLQIHCFSQPTGTNTFPDGGQTLRHRGLDKITKRGAKEALLSLRVSTAATNLEKILPVLRSSVSGGLCGTSALGLSSPVSTSLASLGEKVFKSTSGNDGMVDLPSCMAGLEDKPWRMDYTSPFYLAAINHSDGRCTAGNGLWGAHRMPCSWFQNLQPPPVELKSRQ